jgi:hypothetical protein
MFKEHKILLLFGAFVAVGCNSFSPSTETTSIVTGGVTVIGVKDIPAVNRTRYPDSIGFVYQGPLATILWMQNDPSTKHIEDLERSISINMRRGVVGDILSSAMQQVDPLPADPTTSQMVKQSAQWAHLMAQYTAVSEEYTDLLGQALAAYNSDPTRLQALSDTAALVSTGLSATPASNPGGPLPVPPPPPGQRVFRPARYFADAMKDRDHAYLVKSSQNLQRAIDARNAAAYATAFGDLFYMQNDATRWPRLMRTTCCADSRSTP